MYRLLPFESLESLRHLLASHCPHYSIPITEAGFSITFHFSICFNGGAKQSKASSHIFIHLLMQHSLALISTLPPAPSNHNS